MNKTQVETSIGTFELIKPKAGVRNKALIKAETSTGSLRRSLFMTELLPKTIAKRPDSCDQDVPIEHLLDSMEIEDYDALIEGIDILLDNSSAVEDDKKKE